MTKQSRYVAIRAKFKYTVQFCSCLKKITLLFPLNASFDPKCEYLQVTFSEMAKKETFILLLIKRFIVKLIFLSYPVTVICRDMMTDVS